MKTIFNTIILALLAVFVTACGDASNVNMNPDSGVPDGTVDECESVVSCDDPLADECGLECPDPVSFCNLGDPNQFVPNGCGFNNRGELEQRCIFSLEYDDYVWDDVECVDPDECVIDEVDERSCGINDIGSEYRTCENGHWAEFGSCKFAEYLTHEDFYADAGAVFYNEGDSFNESSVGLGEEFTVSMWVKLNGSGIVVGVYGSLTLFSIVCNLAAECTISYTNDNGNYIGFNLSSDGEFQHLVFTMSNTAGMIAYLDGVEVGSTETPYYGSYAESVVRANDNGYGYAADVKHLSFFDGVLSADEVLDLYNYDY